MEDCPFKQFTKIGADIKIEGICNEAEIETPPYIQGTNLMK